MQQSANPSLKAKRSTRKLSTAPIVYQTFPLRMVRLLFLPLVEFCESRFFAARNKLISRTGLYFLVVHALTRALALKTRVPVHPSTWRITQSWTETEWWARQDLNLGPTD